MIVPFTQRPASTVEPTAMPSQTQLLMAAAQMHQMGRLSGDQQPDETSPAPGPVLGPSSADEPKPPHPRRRHR